MSKKARKPWSKMPEPSLEHIKRLSDDICLFEHAKFAAPFRRQGYTIAGFMIPQRRFAAMDSARRTLVKNRGDEGIFGFLLSSLFEKIKAKRALTPIS